MLKVDGPNGLLDFGQLPGKCLTLLKIGDLDERHLFIGVERLIAFEDFGRRPIAFEG